MDRWRDRVAVITGVDTEIGATLVKALLHAGMLVVAFVRQVEHIGPLRGQLEDGLRKRLFAAKCNISVEEDIIEAFRYIENNFGGVAVLVESAGISRETSLLAPGNTNELRELLNNNVLGVVLCSREACTSMKRCAFDGQIIHINCVAGHSVANQYNLSDYMALKFAAASMVESMRNELKAHESRIKVTSISTAVDPTSSIQTGYFKSDAKDISDAVLYVLSTPERVQIHDLTLTEMGERMEECY